MLERIVAFLISFAEGLCLIAPVLPVSLFAAAFFTVKDQSKDYKLTATSEGIVEETSVARVEFKWSGVRKIQMTGSYIYIFISDTSAIVVPRRAFAEPWEEKQLYDSILALWNSNKNPQPV